jgi:hypothetical protein
MLSKIHLPKRRKPGLLGLLVFLFLSLCTLVFLVVWFGFWTAVIYVIVILVMGLPFTGDLVWGIIVLGIALGIVLPYIKAGGKQ